MDDKHSDQTPRQESSSIAADRTREMLEFSSYSLNAELEHARGWLDSAQLRSPSNYWEVNAVAGALGALANAWGRLTLWTQANSTWTQVADDLHDAMDSLVTLRRRLLTETAGDAEVEELRRILDVLDKVQQIARAGSA